MEIHFVFVLQNALFFFLQRMFQKGFENYNIQYLL